MPLYSTPGEWRNELMHDEANFERVCERIEGQLSRQLTSDERAALRRAYDANMRIIVIHPVSECNSTVRTPTRPEGITAVRTDSLGATT